MIDGIRPIAYPPSPKAAHGDRSATIEEEFTLAISTRLLALGTSAAIILGACSSAGAPSAAPATAAPATAAPTEAPPAQAAYKACVAFDTGGLGDKGFNDLAKKGLDDAAALGFRPPLAKRRAQRTSRTTSSADRRGLPDDRHRWASPVPGDVDATLANPDIAFAQVDAAWNVAGADFTPGTPTTCRSLRTSPGWTTRSMRPRRSPATWPPGSARPARSARMAASRSRA